MQTCFRYLNSQLIQYYNSSTAFSTITAVTCFHCCSTVVKLTSVSVLRFAHIGCVALRCRAVPSGVARVVRLRKLCGMRHVAVHCGILQHVAANTTQYGAPHRNVTHSIVSDINVKVKECHTPGGYYLPFLGREPV